MGVVYDDKGGLVRAVGCFFLFSGCSEPNPRNHAVTSPACSEVCRAMLSFLSSRSISATTSRIAIAFCPSERKMALGEKPLSNHSSPPLRKRPRASRSKSFRASSTLAPRNSHRCPDFPYDLPHFEKPPHGWKVRCLSSPRLHRATRKQ